MALTDRTVLRCTPEEKASWEAAANRADRKLADWIRLMLDSAATVQGQRVALDWVDRAGEQHRVEPVESDNPTSGPRPKITVSPAIEKRLREFKPDFKPPSKKKGRRA